MSRKKARIKTDIPRPITVRELEQAIAAVEEVAVVNDESHRETQWVRPRRSYPAFLRRSL